MHGSLEAQVANRTEQLERELEWRKEAQYQLVVAKELAESANKAKTAFLSSMSHELRTPLNAVLGFGQLLEVDPLISKKPKHKTGIEQILKGGHHLLSLIDDVLDLSKIEDDNLTLSIENIAPDQALKDCLNIVLSLADEYQVTLVNKTVDQSLPVVKADYTRFKQVIINLLSNAIKYSSSQSMVSMISAKSGDNYLRITVTDNGPGIAPDQQKNIFEPFDRLGAESSEIEGTGIGLTIVKQLMEAMDGSVGFESSLDTGSIFGSISPSLNPPVSNRIVAVALSPFPVILDNRIRATHLAIP